MMCLIGEFNSSSVLCLGNLIRVSAKNCALLWDFCYVLSRLRRPSLILFFPDLLR